MPTRNKPPLNGPDLKVEDVFRAAELATLAEDWAKSPYLFEAVQLARYQELCDFFQVDGTSLLFATQSRDKDQEFVLSATQVMPVVGDLPDISTPG